MASPSVTCTIAGHTVPICSSRGIWSGRCGRTDPRPAWRHRRIGSLSARTEARPECRGPRSNRSSPRARGRLLLRTAAMPPVQPSAPRSGPDRGRWIEAASIPALPLAMTRMTTSAGKVQIRYCKVFTFLPSIVERGLARWKTPVLTSLHGVLRPRAGRSVARIYSAIPAGRPCSTAAMSCFPASQTGRIGRGGSALDSPS